MSRRIQPIPQDDTDPSTIRSLTSHDPETGSKILPSVWAEYYGVANKIIPLKNKVDDPLAISLHIVDVLSNIEDYQETFILSNKELDIFDSVVVQNILRIHGVIEYTPNETRPVRYRNPDYCHYNTVVKPITNTERRLKIYDLHTKWGMQPIDWFCDHFGLSKPELQNWAITHDRTPPEQAISEAQHKVGRSVYTTLQWTEWDLQSVAKSLNQDRKTLQTWITNGTHTTLPNGESWKVPEPPADKPWFSEKITEKRHNNDDYFWNADTLKNRVRDR